MLLAACLAPLALQGLLMVVDEFHFHRKRGLPTWERLGHPLDTLTTLACFLVPALAGFSPGALGVYIGLCLFSCVFVTKDEWVHARLCRPGEQWLHAMLFVAHPLVFTGMGVLWYLSGTGEPRIGQETATSVARMQSLLLVLFLCYQVAFWVILGRGRWPAAEAEASKDGAAPGCGSSLPGTQ